MVLAYITWNVNPEIFNTDFTLPILGEIHLAVRYYGLLFALGFVFGYYLMLRFFRKEGLDVKLLDQLSTYMILATIIGARLGHVLFYQPDYYFSNPSEILKVWHGGLASHGAAIGIILALWLFSRKTKRSFLWTIDRIVIVVALAGAFIRTGNLMNSEIYGQPTDVPWGFIFERSDSLLLPRHPTQIYEALAYLAIFVFLYLYYHRKEYKPAQGVLLGWFLTLVFGFRFFVEFLKANQVDFESSLTLNMGQILSIPFVIMGITLLRMAKKGSTPRLLTKGKA
ncbi:MAG TPA: prolipoprotein diacylglyceryl transferase [Bacteroidales bacterium]|nr:prolipoprotein diacylglyceryl transferase [Bacteroidales bacterium]